MCASLYDSVPVWMIAPLKVRRSTIAAQSRGSVNVFVQQLKDSVKAIATLSFLPLGQHLEQQLSAAPVEFHVAEFVDAEKVNAAVAGN